MVLQPCEAYRGAVDSVCARVVEFGTVDPGEAPLVLEALRILRTLPREGLEADAWQSMLEALRAFQELVTPELAVRAAV